MDCCIVIPVFNQLSYTTGCLDSLLRTGVPDSQVVVVNNSSTDGTREFLDSRPELKVIHNTENRGCGFAWNQGSKASSAKWTVLLNNDVLVAPGWLAGLVLFAEQGGFQIVSPAMCEGELDYDLPAHAAEFVRKMSAVERCGIAHGVCFMVRRRVFEQIGFFDDDPRLGGYEDDEFSRRAREAGFRLAISGRAFIHHFGSVTQKSIQAGMNKPNASLGDRDYYRKKYGLTRFKRIRLRWHEKLLTTGWRIRERFRYGYTLVSKREGGRFVWC